MPEADVLASARSSGSEVKTAVGVVAMYVRCHAHYAAAGTKVVSPVWQMVWYGPEGGRAVTFEASPLRCRSGKACIHH